VYLLDISALLTLIEDEAGSDRLETVLKLVGTLLLYKAK
jgi:PIN domain nuclease of toxin-antitoxin system